MSAVSKGTMPLTKFREAVRKGQRFEIVVFRGEEECLLREELSDFVERTIPKESADFNYCEFRSNEVSGETLWNALITLPFMGDRRLIVLEVGTDPRKDVAKALADYFRHPVPTTTLVIVIAQESGKLDWGDERPECVVELEFKTLKDHERIAWAEGFVKRQGKSITAEAVHYLIQSSAKNLADLTAKLNHAILFVGETGEISVQTLMKVSGVSSEFTVFQLEDAILNQKPEEAQRIAQSLLVGGEALLRLLAFHRGTLNKLWQVSRAVKKPANWQSTPESSQFYRVLFGSQNFKIDRFKEMAKRLSEPQIRYAILGLLELEIEAKTSSHPPHRYFEWLWRVCGRGWNLEEPVFQISR